MPRGYISERLTDDPSNLPEGKSCDDCAHFVRCKWLIDANHNDERCDWEPSRFRLRTNKDRTR